MGTNLHAGAELIMGIIILVVKAAGIVILSTMRAAGSAYAEY
jgi:hypothetical protein